MLKLLIFLFLSLKPEATLSMHCSLSIRILTHIFETLTYLLTYLLTHSMVQDII